MKNSWKILIVLILGMQLVMFVYLFDENSENEPANGTNVTINEVNGFSTDFTNIIAELKTSIVTIKNEDNILTGYVYSNNENGIYIVTSGVDSEQNIEVIFNNGETTIPLNVYVDAEKDIQVLEVEVDFNVNSLKMGNSNILKQGEIVIALGQNLALNLNGDAMITYINQNKIISERNVEASINDKFTTAYVGGPIVNMAGEVVGLVNSTTNKFITINELKLVVNNIQDEKYLYSLGLEIIEVANIQTYQKAYLDLDLNNTSGLYIISIDALNPLNVLIQPKEIITKINDTTINTVYDYQAMLYQAVPGTIWQIELSKDNESRIVEVIFND